MKNNLRHIITLILLSISVHAACADGAFRVLDIRSGLCDNSVNCIRQDKNGMIWMATWNGLCRYDGVMFYTFQHAFNDESSIINNKIQCLEIGRDGLWVATDGGLDYLSFSTGRFTRCRVDTEKKSGAVMNWTIYVLVQNGSRLFGTDEGGHLYVHESGDDPTKFKPIKHSMKLNAVCRYKDGLLLAAGPEGVYILSADGRKVLSHHRRRIPACYMTNIYYSRNSRMAFIGNGIGSESVAFAVSGMSFREIECCLPSCVMDAVDYRRGTVFAIDGCGLMLKEGDKCSYLTPANSNISGDAPYTVFVDKDNNLWAGIYRRGVNMLSSRRPWWNVYSKDSGHLTYNIVTAVIPYGDRLYVGLDGGGLDILERATGRLLGSVSVADGSLPGNNVVSMVRDDKYLYMALYTYGMARMPLSGGKPEMFHMPRLKDEKADNVWTMCDDGIGHIWIGGPNVCVFNKKTGKVSLVKGLNYIFCSSMTVHNGYVWLSSNNSGIYKVDPISMKTVAHYSTDSKSPVRLQANDIKYIYSDRNGTLWFTSWSSGFYSLDENKRKLVNYDRTNGLTSHLVSSMAEDYDGNLWLGTFNGLFRYNPKTKLFLRFDEDTPLPTNYTYGSSTFHEGTFYVGSTDGLVSFNPHNTSLGKGHSRVNFISLHVLNEGERERPLFGTSPDKIVLDHSQNFFTLMFTVPDISTPGRIQFSCRLDGLEDSWRELAGRRDVSYTAVPPGHYKFYVRCTDSTGQWGEPSVLEITVTPPWYATLWAKLLWTLLAAGAVAAGVWFYLHEMKIKNEVRISQIEKDKLRELNEAKMNFYTNITHEFRTPVFLIAAQLEELLDAHKSVLSVPASYLQAMYRSANKLNRLISRVIDFRKLDSGVLRLNTAVCDVARFCRDLTEDYEELCSQKNISFEYRCREGSVMLDCDAEKLEVILSNLVSNAFKYTNEGGHVELSIKDETDRVVFAVKDNGIGILEKMRSVIFESFFRTERGVRQSGGDGLGLSFVKSLVELHGGKISVESEVNVGSTFTFYIPKKHPSAPAETAVSTPADGIEKTDEAVKQSAKGRTGVKDAAVDTQTKLPENLPMNPTATHSVLVIDDERETVSLIERALYSEYKVYKAYDGVEGLETARRTLPDVVICDIMMPKMDGLEFLSTMKKDKTLQHIKIIIFTAKTSDEEMLKAYDCGADAYLTKPLSLKVLHKRVDRLIAQTDNAQVARTLTDSKKVYTKEEQIFLLRCREIIDNNLSNPDFNIDFLADKLAMSHSALYKKVKAMTGMSLMEFIGDYKVYKAVQYFKQGYSNIDNVGEMSGFHDAKSFREMFRRKMGMTPKQYVQSL